MTFEEEFNKELGILLNWGHGDEIKASDVKSFCLKWKKLWQDEAREEGKEEVYRRLAGDFRKMNHTPIGSLSEAAAQFVEDTAKESAARKGDIKN